jgi:hypothetical protein
VWAAAGPPSTPSSNGAAAPAASSNGGNGSNGNNGDEVTTTVTGRGVHAWAFDLGREEERRRRDPKVREVPVAAVRRPLGRTRANDEAKVLALMASIHEVGLQEPIDVLEVEDALYGFSGCHRRVCVLC